MRRVLRLVPYVLSVLVVLGLAGCGVGPTDRPVDEGDAAVGGSANPARHPPEPDEAGSFEELVRYFLQASAGGSAQANERVKRYLTGAALAGWVDPPAEDPLSLVRIVGNPTPGVLVSGQGTPVTVTYELIGSLNDQGRVNEIVQLEQRTLTFWVVTPEGELNFRIGKIDGWPQGQLLLSQEGLLEYYDIQPIYFWDAGYTALVPDLRYLPRTLSDVQKWTRRLTWLTAGPSHWLAPGVQAWPVGTSSEPVEPAEDGTLQVRLSAAAAALTTDPEAARRLLFQLQWSLSTGDSDRRIQIYIEDQPITVAADSAAYRSFLHSWTYRREPKRYNITADGVVEAITPTTLPPDLSAAPPDGRVVAAALTTEPTVAAYVVENQFGRYALQIIANGQTHSVDLPQPGNNAEPGRPSFVPGSDFVLVPTGGPDGRLISVSTVTGAPAEASNRLLGVTDAVVSPDGRRVAIIADGEVHVAPLIVTPDSVTVGSNTRQLAAGRLTATAVTWTSDSWLLVAGMREGGQPTLWRVTADSVVAQDVYGDLGIPPLRIFDLVSWPAWTAARAEVLAVTDLGVYRFFNRFSPEPTVTAPFFG
ncbi:MAG: GerMN domain-containing protein [Micromonosporaceae bacterium]|nr:GerMN domain-containing protein [Micromonosporaceae bacterium]